MTPRDCDLNIEILYRARAGYKAFIFQCIDGFKIIAIKCHFDAVHLNSNNKRESFVPKWGRHTRQSHFAQQS